MKAIELKKKYLKEDMVDKVGLIAIKPKLVNGDETEGNAGYWYHVHDDEEVPEKDFDIAFLHIKKLNPKK